MHFDFRQVQDIDSFVSIPEGVYVCRVAEVREGLARDSSVRWSMRLEVAEGEYAGRTAGWDSLTWSERGIRRVKRVLEVLGLDVGGEVEVQPSDLIGLEARIVFQTEEREDPFSGRRTLRLRVPYAGYSSSRDGGAGDRANGRSGGEGTGQALGSSPSSSSGPASIDEADDD
jgi:hypothetical protein